MLNKIAIVGALGVLMTVAVWANEELIDQTPELPQRMESGDSIEPEINIIQQDDRTIEEYRVNGQLYMIKVIPIVGPAYYLMDTDGDGNLETTRNELDNPEVPNWILLEW
ncbi:DUF2782 domain-containing protein [Methylophaga sp. OBS3]|jgi:hypothetical protein|uniref:DUF2782 domain-containing protein n=1 Tax=Methylophaga sp. OBS3 TaxID=2991934 RepID=UPI002250C89A|nr:DUF2782 domain-containing protein [Methylophaga sp. OBS3]MCX4190760.1 DUF2782 domain-containing protein [Methylophaga sp. OBS3]